MSTRATYRIYDNYNNLDVYFYVHYDNYPLGAAFYFQKMVDYIRMDEAKYGRPTYAEAFFRANKEAHFTKSHYCHGDTEYQYNIIKTKDKGYILQAFEIGRDWKRYNEEVAQLNQGNSDPEPKIHATRKKFFEGSVEDFIKLYGEQEEDQELESGMHLKLVKS